LFSKISVICSVVARSQIVDPLTQCVDVVLDVGSEIRGLIPIVSAKAGSVPTSLLGMSSWSFT